MVPRANEVPEKYMEGVSRIGSGWIGVLCRLLLQEASIVREGI